MERTHPHRRSRAWAPGLLLAAALALSTALKLTVDAGGPLWLDEGWTLGIVDRPTWAAFAEQLRLEVNPPLYFLLLRGWTAGFGLSDGALRSLSTLFACLLPLAALLPGAGRGRERLLWAALLALWPPGIAFAQEARGYALLTLLAAGQTALFAHLLARPSLARATAWVAAAALTALTQHHALALTALQGLVLLARERRGVLRLWPAALAFLPALAWDAVQAPRLAVFGRPEHAWYLPFDARLAREALDVATGSLPLWACAVALAGALAFTGRAHPRAEQAADQESGALAWAALASVAGALLLLALGALKPSLTPRYLAPFAPGVLLAPVVLLRGARARDLGAAGAVALFACAAGLAALSADNRSRRAYQMETASADLMAAGSRRLAFLWDNPADGALAPAERAALADAFFVRARRPVAVDRVAPAPGEDPNAALAAATPPGGALLWLWDVRVPRTAAVIFPPRLEALAPDLACRRYAYGALGVVACVRKPLAWTK